MESDSPEISDLIVDFDTRTLTRRPVRQQAVLDHFEGLGNRRAIQVVRAIPSRGGVLDPDAVDALLVRVHTELQRLSEEFMQGERIRRLLVPLLAAVRAAGAVGPIRVVDVGCGLGFVVRWLAAFGKLGDDVQLVGCDYNRALVQHADSLARAENLLCEFVVANAFTLDQPGHIFISTGVIHHFRDQQLVDLFRQQARSSTWAFCHYDVCPTWASTLGAWLFHASRMREPLSLHDGVLSVRRAHTDASLVAAAKLGAPDFIAGCFEGPNQVLPLVRLLRPLLGLRPQLREPFLAELGSVRATRFRKWT